MASAKLDENMSQPGIGQSIDGVLDAQSMAIEEVAQQDEQLDNELSTKQSKKNMNKTQD